MSPLASVRTGSLQGRDARAPPYGRLRPILSLRSLQLGTREGAGRSGCHRPPNQRAEHLPHIRGKARRAERRTGPPCTCDNRLSLSKKAANGCGFAAPGNLSMP
mgnify:CR=1 FL=1